MEEYLRLIANNHMSLIIILGGLISLTGLILTFASGSKTHGVAMAIIGIVFASLPFITSVKFNKDGLELLTNTQKVNEELVKNLEDQRKAIEELRSGLAAVQQFSKNVSSTPNFGGTYSPATSMNFENLDSSLGNSLTKTDDFLNGSLVRQQSLKGLLKQNDSILNNLGGLNNIGGLNNLGTP